MLEPCDNLPPIKKGKDPLEAWKQGWFITINTNSAHTIVRQPLEAAWGYILSHLAEFMCGRPGGRITKVEHYTAVERGPKFKRWHIHAQLIVESEGIAFLEYEKIRQFINRKIKEVWSDFKGCRFHARLLREFMAAERIREYLEKEGNILYF